MPKTCTRYVNIINHFVNSLAKVLSGKLLDRAETFTTNMVLSIVRPTCFEQDFSHLLMLTAFRQNLSNKLNIQSNFFSIYYVKRFAYFI